MMLCECITTSGYNFSSLIFRYCSEKCKLLHAREYHSLTCGLYQKLGKFDGDILAIQRLLIDIHIRRWIEQKEEAKWKESRSATENHEDDIIAYQMKPVASSISEGDAADLRPQFMDVNALIAHQVRSLRCIVLF